MRISDWSSDVCSSDLTAFLCRADLPSPQEGCRPGGLSLLDSHISSGGLATAKRLARSVIAGLVPAIHARSRLLTSLERLGATAEWTLGTSPRVTAKIDGGDRAIAADDV